MTPRTAARIFWCSFYAPVILPIYFAIAIPVNRGDTVTDVNPAFFLPLLPIGLSFAVSGWFVATNYQGVREVFARSFWARIVRQMGRYEMAGPYGAGLMIAMGGLLFLGGLIAALTLLARAF